MHTYAQQHGAEPASVFICKCSCAKIMVPYKLKGSEEDCEKWHLLSTAYSQIDHNMTGVEKHWSP